ncbi:MAG: tyrosine-type recombinase/integrase [Pseudomonadota bacterium]
MTGTVHLTDAVAAAARPRRRERTLHDARLKGFGLRVLPSGTRTWILRHPVSGARQRLGRFPALGCEEARGIARALLLGDAPPEPTPTLTEIYAAWREARMPRLAPTTQASFATSIETRILPALGQKPVDRLTVAEFAEWFRVESERKPGAANWRLTQVRQLLKFARETGRVPEDMPDPSAALRRNRRAPVGRILTRTEIAALGRALDDLQDWDPLGVALIRLLLLTGCRLAEIRTLDWRDVEPDRLRLRHAKRGPRDVLLSDAAREVFEALKAYGDAGPVFPDPARLDHPMPAPRQLWTKLKARAELPPRLRLHDLRHTFASMSLMSGESLAITGKLLGHRSTASTEQYVHLDGHFLDAAAERVTSTIQRLLG